MTKGRAFFASVIFLLLLSSHGVTPHEQVCTPCSYYCDLVGSKKNADCVKSGRGNEPGGIPGECYKEGLTAERTCLSNCFVCRPSTAHPDFLLISILYAPPGNASSTSFGQSSSAGVTYGITHNFASNDSVGVQASLLGARIPTGGDSGSIGFNTTINENESDSEGFSRTFQFTTTTTSTTNNNLRSASDQIAHGQDLFLVWVNPLVTAAQIDRHKVLAYLSTVDGQRMDIISVSANELQNGIPSSKLNPQQHCQPGGDCVTLPGLSVLTRSDVATILKQDPFLNSDPMAPPDPSRYVYLQDNALENTKVGANGTETITVSGATANVDAVAHTLGTQLTYSTGVTVSAPLLSFGSTSGQSWNWSTGTSQSRTTGSSQQASVTLSSTTPTCCGVSPDTTCFVAIYEDMIYHTFAFVPEQTCQRSKPPVTMALSRVAAASALSGIVTLDSNPLANERVTVTLPNGKFISRIYTDHSGKFFVGHLSAGKVLISVREKTVGQIVAAGSTARVAVNLVSH